MNLLDTIIDTNMRGMLRKSQGEAEAHRLLATLQMECLVRRASFLLRSGLMVPAISPACLPSKRDRFGSPRIEQRLVSLFAD